MAAGARMAKELAELTRSPPEGITVWPEEASSAQKLRAALDGPQGSPYAGGCFHLSVAVPERYPFEPPGVAFLTPVHHPNVDSAGCICLDLLKPPPSGAWKPSFNVRTVLQSVSQLLLEPNPDDPLVPEIAEELVHNKELFRRNAAEHARTHAMQPHTTLTSSKSDGDASTACTSDEPAADKENVNPHSAGTDPHPTGTPSEKTGGKRPASSSHGLHEGKHHPKEDHPRQEAAKPRKKLHIS